VLVGVNLLREGLDLPEVSLVAILDADKEGFLRSHRSLTQTIGRAARNDAGRVIMYADKMTDSMKKTIEENNRRRELQKEHNRLNNITPTTIHKSKESILGQTSVADRKLNKVAKPYDEQTLMDIAADPVYKFMSKDNIKLAIQELKRSMTKAARELDFIEAARFRDEIAALERRL